MNRIFNLSAIIATFLAFSVVVSAQTAPSAAELFKKYAAALGGEDAAKKITSRTFKGTVELKPVGVEGTFETYQKASDKSFLTMNLPGLGDILDGFNGKEGWSQDPMSGLRVKEGEELEQTKQAADFYYEFNLAKYYPEATVTGTEKVNEMDAYVVKADADTILYFDVNTGLLVRSDKTMISPQGKVQAQTYQSNYQEVDGVKVPFDIKQSVMGMEFVMKTTEAKSNVEIEDTKFNKPE